MKYLKLYEEFKTYNSWDDFEREDLRIISDMANIGYSVEFNWDDKMREKITPENPPAFPVSFKKDSHRIWKVKDGWMSADIIDNKATNHNLIPSIEEFINKSSDNE